MIFGCWSRMRDGVEIYGVVGATFVLRSDGQSSSDEVVLVSNISVGTFIFLKRICWKKFSGDDVSS